MGVQAVLVMPACISFILSIESSLGTLPVPTPTMNLTTSMYQTLASVMIPMLFGTSEMLAYIRLPMEKMTEQMSDTIRTLFSRSACSQKVFKRLSRPVGKSKIFWFSFIFSHKQRLGPLGYCSLTSLYVQKKFGQGQLISDSLPFVLVSEQGTRLTNGLLMNSEGMYNLRQC